MTGRGLQEKPRPFCRLLESVERARAARESSDKANKLHKGGTTLAIVICHSNVDIGMIGSSVEVHGASNAWITSV